MGKTATCFMQWHRGCACAFLLSGCTPHQFLCDPPNAAWFNGIPLAEPTLEASAKRLEVPSDKCGLYFYQQDFWTNSWNLVDLVWVVSEDTKRKTKRIETVEDMIFAVWHLAPGKYRVHVYSEYDSAKLVVDCPVGEVVFLADTKNAAGIERVDIETGRKAIHLHRLSAGIAQYTYYSGARCLPPGIEPCGLENTPDCRRPP